MHISLAAEELFRLGPLSITNSLITTWIVMIFLIAIAFFGTRNIKKIPKGIQNFLEIIIEALLKLMEDVTGSKKQARTFFPLIATIFLFIVTANWFGLLPGIGTIGIKSDHSEAAVEQHVDATEHSDESTDFVTHEPETSQAEHPEEQTHDENTNTEQDLHESEAALPMDDDASEHEDTAAATHDSGSENGQADEEHSQSTLTPLFRPSNTDLNMTLAIAIIAVIGVQVFGIGAIGFFKYASKFINFKGPVDFFIGLLELVSEVAKIISFSFRLFGNIFAGEVLLVVIAFLLPYVAPLPFYFLELFVGFIQALVFAMLTLVFATIAITPHDEH